jgi:GT2 family glycosyltransferase
MNTKILKKNIDVVIVSDAKTQELKEITEQALGTVGEDVNVIVIESNKNIHYEGVTVIYPDVPFNYNEYLNIGASYGTADYIFFSNNDVIFYEDWDFNLMNNMKRLNVVSASPICPEVALLLNIDLFSGNYYGYEIISRFCGWAFMWTRKFYDYVGGLDETFKFWCSDNVTVEQLLRHNKKHILVTSSVVQHINSGHNTIVSLEGGTLNEYTLQEVKKFNCLFNKNS